MTSKVARGFSPAIPILLLALASCGCGYALAGRGSSLPEYIKVISVPQFKNATPVFDVDRIMTERVRSELINRGKYRVDDKNADAIVQATIQSVSLQPATYDTNRQATRYIITISASVTFTDLKTRKELWSNPSLTFRDEYQISNPTSAADVTAFFGSETESVRRLATAFARSVVSAMLEAF
jgi:hypothetical protein